MTVPGERETELLSAIAAYAVLYVSVDDARVDGFALDAWLVEVAPLLPADHPVNVVLRRG